MSVEEAIKLRWSCRRYMRKPLEKEKFLKLFEAARRAPSSYNEQPWRFIVGLNYDETHSKLLEVLVPANQEWAKDAPLLGLVVAKIKYSHIDRENPARKHDCGMALAFLFLQAVELGLSCRAMGGYDKLLAREVFRIPEDYEPVVCFACGYPDEEPVYKERKPLQEILFKEEFGKKFII